MSNVTDNESFGSGLTAINELSELIGLWPIVKLFSSINGCTMLCKMFNLNIQDDLRILEIFNIQDFYMIFYRFLYQAFYILENFNILENILTVSYFCAPSKLQYACLINIGRRKQIYLQSYNLYAYGLH